MGEKNHARFPGLVSSKWLCCQRKSANNDRRTFTSPLTFIVAVLYCCTVLANYGYNYFGLFLKSRRNSQNTPTWTIAQVNAIPIGGSAIQVVFVWIWAIISDTLQIRWSLILVQAVIALAPLTAMTVWTRHPSIGDATAYASYFIQFTVLGTAPLIFSWLADL